MASQPSVTTARIGRDRLGPSGIDGYLHIVDERRDDVRPAEQRLTDQTPRVFAVRAALAKGFMPHETIRASIVPEEGGCYITAPEDIRLDVPGGFYAITRNGRGELALVSRSVTASSYKEALELFLAGLTPSLDHLAFLSNTPIRIDMLECRDDANHITVVSYRTPYSRTSVTQGGRSISTPLFPVYALHREALAAESNFYRFLCFHKILEGVLLKLRPQLRRMAQQQGITIAGRQDVVPNDPELGRFQPAYIGRRIRELFDGELRESYRRSVAHFALDDGTISNPSSHREGARFADMIHLAQVCARQVTSNIEAEFSQFFAQGGRIDAESNMS
jgi:hypothetical protein